MNNLENLKHKLMVKPNIQEREKVNVILNFKKDNLKIKKNTIKKDINEKDKNSFQEVIEESFGDLSNQISEIQNIEGILPIKVNTKINDEEDKNNNIVEVENNNFAPPKIIDMTNKGYDRQALLDKLAENKKRKITIKPFTLNEDKTIEALPIKKKQPKVLKKLLIIEDEEVDNNKDNNKLEKVEKEVEKLENEVEEVEKEEKILEKEEIPINLPKEKKRITKKVEKGIAVLGPEVVVEMGDTILTKRLPKKSSPVIIKVGSYIMNNREIFVNFINSLFEPYKRELEENRENISCDNIGKTNSDFSLLTHQKIVRDYMNLYTPYRGLLLYHGLGSGKTCTSIAIAEGMKESKNIIIMTPASLRSNYIGELKKCGDQLYKKNQYWEWISTEEHPDTLETMSAILNLPQEFIRKHRGAFFINIKKRSNYDELSDNNKQILEEQLNEMINQKYKFINYNGLREKRLEEMTSNYTKNIFDNCVVIIDEAHNFISRIVNKLKKEKPIKEDKRGEKEHLPLKLATKLYEMLLMAKNTRIILLSGTPVINYPNEFAILFNILRGYIKTWSIQLVVNTKKKIDKNSLHQLLLGEKTLDYLDYSPSSKILTITRNPFGFKNKIKKESGYQGLSNTKKKDNGDIEFENEFISDDDFERKIISILRKNDIDIITDGITIKYRKALPDNFDEFNFKYINENDRKIKNSDALKRRILGLSSYFRSAHESLLPKYNKQLGLDYHIIRIPMSDVQFKVYEDIRKEERKVEKVKPKKNLSEDYQEKSSTYRIFSRLVCNFVIPDRPQPIKTIKKDDKIEKEDKKEEEINEEKKDEKEDEKEDEDNNEIISILKEGKKIENNQDLQDNREGEIEGDEILEKLGGTTYIERLHNKLKDMEKHSNDFFTPDALQIYSPKFLNILENITDTEYQGLHLVYSQFRTAEGIGLFTLVLNKNGFTQFKINKNSIGLWEINIAEKDEGKPTYALYTGTETVEEKEIIRKIYNGEWDDIPDSISNVLKSKYRNNNMGEVIKIFMITSSGSEGINLRNTRYVHLMDPYWHPVRSEQVIGRARRICSHKDLPIPLQTVEVFVYLMVFSESQLISDEAIELKRKDLSTTIPKVPQTSDQYLFELSERKAELTNQLTNIIKESAFDCFIYSNGKCVNFGDPTIDKFSYVPDYTEQQNDTTIQANKIAIEWKGKPIKINGQEYVYRKIDENIFNIYDKKSYEDALVDNSIIPLQIGTYEKKPNGDYVFKSIVTK